MNYLSDDIGNKILAVEWRADSTLASTSGGIRARMQEIKEQRDEISMYVEHLQGVIKASREEYEANVTALAGLLDTSTWEQDRAALEYGTKLSYNNTAANNLVHTWTDAFAPGILRSNGIVTPSHSDYSRMVPAAMLWFERDQVPTAEEVEGVRRFAKATAFTRYCTIRIMEYTLSRSWSYYLIVDIEQDRALISTSGLPIDDDDFDDDETWGDDTRGTLEEVLIQVGAKRWWRDTTNKSKPYDYDDGSISW